MWRSRPISAIIRCRRVAPVFGAVLLLLAMLGQSSVAPRSNGLAAPVQPSTATRAAAQQAYGKLPLAFEVNVGQAKASARFLAHGVGYTLALGTNGATLSVQPSQPPASSRSSDPAALIGHRGASTVPGPVAQLDGAAVRMQWVGGNPHPQISGENKLPGVVNYFMGNDPAQWRTNIATYAKVRYSNIYPGIDLVYYGNQDGQLEYDFDVTPGADPSHIQLAYSGSQGTSVDGQGNLQLRLSNGQTLAQQAPSIYQLVSGTRRPVMGGYRLGANGQVSFALGSYNAALSLVIDPKYRYLTYLGGSDEDGADAIAVDSSGGAYITGDTSSTDFPVTPGVVQGSHTVYQYAFVTKIDASGSFFAYSTYLGGNTGDSSAAGIAVDASGNAYITGQTQAGNFPTTSGALQTSAGPFGNAFVTKLNPTGTALVYSTYLGQNSPSGANGIALDSSGNAYIAGRARDSFPTTAGAFQTTNGTGYVQGFVCLLNASGNALTYATYLEGTNNITLPTAVALDSAGSAYVVGLTEATNFPTTPSSFQTTYHGGSNGDGFVTKFNATGTGLIYSSYLGGSDDDAISGIAVDTSKAAYVTGFTYSTDFPTTTGAFQTAPQGQGEAIVAKVNPGGTALTYSTYLGGSSPDYGVSIALNSSGNAYITGYTSSTTFPITSGAFEPQHSGNDFYEAFVTELNGGGSGLVYSTYMGDEFGDYSPFATIAGNAIAVDGSGIAYVAGSTPVNGLPIMHAMQPAFAGGSDAFVMRLPLVAAPTQTVGAYNPANAAYYLRYSNSSGNSNNQFGYGPAGCIPLSGDWTGKGYDSIGVYCATSGTFYLKNTNSGGNADLAFNFGPPNCQPLVGDWTGGGVDTVGVDCTGTFYLRNSNSGGNADVAFRYGPTSGCTPVAGDWTRKHYDTIGIYCAGAFYLRNSNSAGNANLTIVYGPSSGCVGETGDWTGKGYDTIGVDCAGTFYLRNSNSAGNADIAFLFGAGSFKPLAGAWVAPS